MTFLPLALGVKNGDDVSIKPPPLFNKRVGYAVEVAIGNPLLLVDKNENIPVGILSGIATRLRPK